MTSICVKVESTSKVKVNVIEATFTKYFEPSVAGVAVRSSVPNQQDPKKAGGAAGLFTKGITHRTTLYHNTVILALAPHVNPQLDW